MFKRIKSLFKRKNEEINPFTKPRVIDRRIESYTRCRVCGNDTIEECVIGVNEYTNKDMKKFICVTCDDAHYVINSDNNRKEWC